VAKTPGQPGSPTRAAENQGPQAAAPSESPNAAATESAAPPQASGPGRFKQLRNRVNALAGRPGPSYYWIIGTTLALTIIGRMTVLSASTAETISKGKDPYDLFLKESGFALGGIALMFVLSFVPARLYKKMAWPLFILAVVLLGLIFTPLGIDINGNKNWLQLGPITFQPSEAAKLALAVWTGAMLAVKGPLVRQFMHVMIPVGVGGALILALILGGDDMGTAIIIGMMMLAGLMFAGVRKRLLFLALGAAALAAAALSLLSGNRVSRFASWLGDCSEPGACDQSLNGLYALASGGWFGVGLGQSRQKWNWIPEAHNDFIFAIIGEEFGLLGTVIILALYGALAYAIFRVITQRNDPFARIVCGMIMMWIIGQAGVNIGAVTGLLPVIGVPLPLISYGGTALVMVLAAIGVVLSFARSQPEKVSVTP